MLSIYGYDKKILTWVGRFGNKMMNLSFGNDTKMFNLLSIGQRAVGKTVFLVGSYAELHANSLTEKAQQLWFDCQYSYVQENIEKIFNSTLR